MTPDIFQRLQGYIINNYTVLKKAPKGGGRQNNRWSCKCRCGEKRILYTHQLIAEKTPACAVCGAES